MTIQFVNDEATRAKNAAAKRRQRAKVAERAMMPNPEEGDPNEIDYRAPDADRINLADLAVSSGPGLARLRASARADKLRLEALANADAALKTAEEERKRYSATLAPDASRLTTGDVEAKRDAAKAKRIAAKAKFDAKIAARLTRGKADREAKAAVPKTPRPPTGKRAEVLAAAKRGELPMPPDFTAETHKRWRESLNQIVHLVKARDVAGLKANGLEPKSSSRAAICRYRDLAIVALNAAS